MSTDKIKVFKFNIFLQKNWLVLIILIMSVLIVYSNSFFNDFVSDDVRTILKNSELRDFSAIFNYGPIAIIRGFLYYVIAELFGRQPFAYRSLNILLHLGTVITSFMVLKLLINKRTAFIASLILAVHPLQIESVAWISGGPYSQYGFFLMLGFLLYILSWKNHKYFYYSLIAFSMSLLSSEKAMIIPIILLFFSLSYSQFQFSWKKMLWFIIPGIIVVLWLVMQIPQRRQALQKDYYVDKGISNPVIQIPVALTSYVQLVFWPQNLTLFHSEMNFTVTNYLIRLIGFIGLVCLIIYSFRRHRHVFFWLSFFIIVLLPTLTPFGISWVVAERYAYLASLGIYAIIAIFFDYLLKRFPQKHFLIKFIIIIIIIILSLRTIQRNFDWKTEDSLWLSNAKSSPTSPQNHNNLGDYYYKRNEYQKAIAEFKLALYYHPNYADAYHNLANIYYKTGKIEEAKQNYEKAVSINPKLWPAYQNLAGITYESGDFDKAEEYLKKAINIMPNDSPLHVDLGVVYAKKNQRELARSEARIALDLDPANQSASKLLLELQ